MKGHTVRVKHGSGLQMHLSKMQMKKHLSSKKKGQGGYNMTMDPYQCQMHGEGFLDDVGSAFKKMGDSFVQNVAKPVASEVVKEGKKRGRKVASKLIHEGIPFATSTLGGLAGSTLGSLTGDPLGVEAGEVIGQQLGEYGGKKLADYVGRKTGYGMKLTPAMLKEATKVKLLGEGIPEMLIAQAMGYGAKGKKLKMKGGTALIDQPFTARQAVNTTGAFIKNPAKTLGFGIVEDISRNKAVQAIQGKRGGTLLIDQPFTARQAVNSTGDFFKDPAKTLGFGLKTHKHAKRHAKKVLIGGTALIDQPFTARQAVNTTGRFIKNPAGTLGFGRLGGALLPAGHS